MTCENDAFEWIITAYVIDECLLLLAKKKIEV